MHYSTYNISLDIHSPASQVSLSVKKGDTLRKICAVFTENGKPYNLSAIASFQFRAKKPADENGDRAIVFDGADRITQNKNACITSNKVWVKLLQEYTGIAGVADCEFTLYDKDNNVVTSPRFTIVIHDTLVADEEIEAVGSNDLTYLATLVSNTQDLIDDVTGKLENGEFVGEQGVPGERGERGERGKQGEQGVSGVYVGSGEMPEGYNVQVDPDGEAVVLFPELSIGTVETLPEGSDATATITGTAEYPTLNLGLPMGAQGEDGQRGIDGYTPYPGDNGNWFINGVDTGKPWQGERGGQGPKGEPGQDLTDKPWVLIDDIKLTEDVTKIVPNFPAGTYKEMYMRGVIGFSKTDGSTNAVTTYITLGNVKGDLSYVRTTTGGSLGTQAYRYIAEAKMMPDGMPYFESRQSAYTSHMAGNGAQIYYNTGYLGTNASECLPPFSIYISTANVCFNTGTKLEIWGR